MYVKHLSVAIVSIILTYSVLKFVPMHSFESALSSFVYGVFITILYTLILLSMFYFFRTWFESLYSKNSKYDEWEKNSIVIYRLYDTLKS